MNDDGWRDISTAPKDGTPVKLRYASGFTADAIWLDDDMDVPEESDGGGTIVFGGLYEDDLRPTHWKPLYQ